MNILGISCYFHDSAACLICDEKLYAAQEERFNRIKHSQDFPIRAINFCLSEANITVNDLDIIVFYEKPFLKFWRVLKSFIETFPYSYRAFMKYMPRYLGERLILPIKISEELGYDGKVLFSSHHISHSASAFFSSPFNEAAIVTADGVGEFATLTISKGEGNTIKTLKEQRFPNSPGLIYSAFTSFLGFRANGGEGKVMAMASYGKPVFKKEFSQLFDTFDDGSFCLKHGFFDFKSGQIAYTSKFIKMFGKQRNNGEELLQKHFDIAATLQDFLEKRMIAVTQYARKLTGSENICMSGGVLLNCVMNRKIEKKSGFKNIFIQPAAGDAGGALGAALYVKHAINKEPRFLIMENASLGPRYSNSSIKNTVLNSGFKCEYLEEEEMLERVCSDIYSGKIIGWFQGRMEFGPRALGKRSILASPSISNMREILNDKVKHREWFRPYGISILREFLSDYVDTSTPNNFMLNVAWINEDKKNDIPAAVHIDGSVRYQTVDEKDGIYYRLIKKYYQKFNIPLIINTSFNDNNEPIVCSPEDAVKSFSNMNIDRLCIGNYYLSKKA